MVFCLYWDSICGMDTDDIFAYTTQKVVWIRDRWIGFLYYSMICLVLLWIVGKQILWENDHFMLKDVHGMPRMWLSHPTVNDCDPGESDCKSAFRRLVELPYCDQYRGPDQFKERAHCEFKDRITLQDTGSRVQSVFIPTAVETVTEKRHCHPSAANGYSCDNVYETLPGTNCLHDHYLCKTRANRTNQFFYVADINNFAIRFTSSYERGDIRGTSLMHQGWVGVCRKLMRLSNTTQTWSDRKENAKHKCTEDELEMEMLPCKAGVDCSQVRSFDRLEDTGVNVASRHLQEVISKQISDHFDLAKHLRLLNSREAPAELSDEGTIEHRLRHKSKRRRSRTSSRRAGGPTATGRSRLRHRGADLSELQESEEPLIFPKVVEGKRQEMYSDNWGDVFKVSRLLELAGADLDRNFNMDGWSARQAGTVLEVQAVYNNLHPLISSFGYNPVSYHYTVRQLTIPYVNRMKMSAQQPADFPHTRKYEVQYGVLIYFKVGGSFGFFNFVYLIVMLTAAFALTTTATTITDIVGLYLHPRRKNYFHLKYQVSSDFSDTWQCSVCGFHNKKEHDTCQGHDRWACPEEEPPCGAPRPEG